MLPKEDISRKKLRENRKTGSQIMISKLGSGASSNLVGFRELASDEDK